ncbi:MAG: ATP cone domain-containing protein [bacterium]
MTNRSQVARILRRDGSIASYDRERIVNAIFKASVSSGKPDMRLSRLIARRAEKTLGSTYGRDGVPSVEDIQDIVENALMESGHPAVARNYIIYRHHRAQLRAVRSQPFEMSDIIPYRKIYEVLLWNLNHKCDSVPALNSLIAAGQFPRLIRECEERYRDEVTAAASQILARSDNLRLIIIAGPSASGKTTTMIKISEHLKKNGFRLKAINIDNYFFDLENHPRDEFGDYDYETPQAIDLKLINQHLAQLLDGGRVLTPHYDFKTGKRALNVHEMKLAPNELLLIDSLHGLYKDMTRVVSDSCKFRLYLETLGQFRSETGDFMRWADNRLLRRMIRDRQHRNSMPIQTIMHWHYVRTSELSHIIPFINTADAVINSAMPYELPLLRARLLDYFPKAMREFKNNPKKRDAYVRARRVYGFLKPLVPVHDMSAVPRTSVLREFIGGSRYSYD